MNNELRLICSIFTRTYVRPWFREFQNHITRNPRQRGTPVHIFGLTNVT